MTPARRSMLVYFLLTASMVPVLLGLFYFPYLSVRNHTITQFNAEQVTLARQVSEGIEDDFRHYTDALRYLSEQQAVVRMDANGCKMFEAFHSLHAHDISAITRVDSQGRIVYTVPFDQSAIGRDVSGQAHNREIGVRHHLTVSDPFRTVQGFQSIAFAYPVFKEGQFDGSVSLLIPFDQLAKKHLEALHLNGDAVPELINRSGIVLYRPIPAHIGKSVTAVHAMEPELAAIIQKRIAGGQGAARFTWPGPQGAQPQAYQIVFAPVHLPGDNIWSFAIANPESKALASMAHFTRQWRLTAGLVIGLLLLFAFVLQTLLSRNAEEKSRQAVQEQLIRLLELTPIGIIVADMQGTILYCNNAISELLDLPAKEEAIGCKTLQFVHDADKERVKERIKRLRNGQRNELECIRVVTAKGEVREAEVLSNPYVHAGHDGYIILMRNMTENRRLEESRRLLAIAIAQAKESVVITDADGTIEYVNPAFCQVTGYTVEEAIGQNPRILKSNRHDDTFYKKMWETLGKGQVWEGRLINRRKDGGLYTEQSSISPVRDEHDRIMHFVAVKRDISHEVALEEQLQQAQKMEAIGTLAGGIAHDFNNILGAILGFTDLSLLQCPKESPMYENLQHIRMGGKRAADLVQQILTFSRQKPQQRIPVAILPLIRECIRLLRATLPATIAIQEEISVEDPWVVADPVHVQQIIMNLGTNAYHAMREKGGTLTVRLYRLSRGTGLAQIALEVEDEGYGMDQKTRERIFDPFFTTKAPGQGTGMGLSVVHGIVKDMGGEIQVVSSPGRGALFRVLLPLAVAKAAETDEEQRLGDSGKGEHILLVDDEPDIRDTCHLLLTARGYRVTSYTDPHKALRLLQKEKGTGIDLVITDQTMPGMTGTALLAAIHEARPGLPVLLCTGYSHELDEEKARALGARQMLMKPIDFQHLLRVIREVLDERAKVVPADR